jgi:hypothetical protein
MWPHRPGSMYHPITLKCARHCCINNALAIHELPVLAPRFR